MDDKNSFSVFFIKVAIMLYVFFEIISTANNLAVSSRSQGLYILKIRSNKNPVGDENIYKFRP